jgi:hypothetical protein
VVQSASLSITNAVAVLEVPRKFCILRWYSAQSQVTCRVYMPVGRIPRPSTPVSLTTFKHGCSSALPGTRHFCFYEKARICSNIAMVCPRPSYSRRRWRNRATAQTVVAPVKRSPLGLLARLPAEIRNMIYGMLLVGPECGVSGVTIIYPRAKRLYLDDGWDMKNL